MRGASIFRRVCQSASRFVRNDQGNIAVIFALAIIPIISFVGAAVDYSRANAARSSMQSALDATALMLSKNLAAGSITTAQLTTQAQNYFTALYTNTDAQSINITATYTAATSTASSTIQVNGSGSVTTDFMKVAGFTNIPFNVSSTTAWGNTRLRVAMVLDNTGSMADNGKIAALRTAASNMVDQLSAMAKTPGDVYISIIPFAKDVNVGSSNYNQNWIDWTDWNAANSTQVCSSYFLFYCTGYTTTPANHNTWTGCVTDRTQSYDTLNTAPTAATVATLFPAEEYYENGQYYCKSGNNPPLQQIVPLSYNWTSLKATISAMQPTGGTDQPIGLAWGWMSLTQTSPLNAPALDSNYTYNQAIIILSDGLNTEDRWPAYGNGVNQVNGQIDARQKILCDNIKAQGITIFAIQVNTSTPADPTSPVLSYCASGSQNFYLLYSASQVITAFNQIGTQLSQLRITK